MAKLLLCLCISIFASAEPVRILIAVHSQTGHTRALAEAIRAGAAIEGVEVAIRNAEEVKAEDVRAAAGILIGTPVHWQTPSAETKHLLDRMGEWLGKEFGEGKTAGVFCTSGSPSNGADLTRLSVIAALLSQRFVVIGGTLDGGYGSLGPQSAGAPDAAAGKDARAFGARFARLTLKLKR